MHTRARHTHMNENKSKTPHTRDTHTHHDDTTGPEGGDCMLVDGGSEIGSTLIWLADPPTVASPPSNG